MTSSLLPEEAGLKNGNPADTPALHIHHPYLRHFLLLLLFLLVGMILYFHCLGCFFVWDEYFLILDNANQGAFEWKSLPKLFCKSYFPYPTDPDLPGSFPYYRPIPVLLHGLSYRAFAFFFPAYHLESLLLHCVNAFLIYLLFSLLLRDQTSRGYPAVPLGAALLFLIHPRNVETVSIIANQTGLLCTFFSLLSLYSWSRALTCGRHPVRLYLLSLTTLLLATLSKESAYVLPLLHAALALLFFQRKLACVLPALAGFFLAPGIPLLVRLFVVQREPVDAILFGILHHSPASPSLGSVGLLLLHQLEQWFFPIDIQFFQYAFSPDKFTFGLGFVAGALVFLLAGALLLMAERRVFLLAAAWFFVFYFPSANLISMGAMPGGGLKTGAHHLYPSHAGLALLLAAVILSPGTRMRGNRLIPLFQAVSFAVIGSLLVLLASQTFRFTNFYRNPDRFYEAVIRRSPIQTGAWQNYGVYQAYTRKDPLRAEQILLKGIQTMDSLGYRRGGVTLTRNLLYLYAEQGMTAEAETLLQCVSEPWVKNVRGNLYFWRSVQCKNRKEARLGAGSALEGHGSGMASPEAVDP